MRFYRPTLKQPVSTFVEAPLEFIQGVMEKDQLDYDKNIADTKAQSALLDNIVVHDIYKADKDKKVAELQGELEKARTSLMESGDVNAAADAIYNVQNKITKDTFLKEAPAYSKKIWDTEEELRKNNENVAAYNNFYNPYWQQYSKGWKNPDGSIKAFSPGQLFEKNLDIQKKQKDMMGDFTANAKQYPNIKFDTEKGLIIDSNTGLEHISGTQIRAVADQKAIDFMKTPEAAQGFRRNNMMYGKELTPEEHLKVFADEMYRAAINQIYTKETGSISAKEMSDDFYGRITAEQNPNQWNPYNAIQVTDDNNVSKEFSKSSEAVGSVYAPAYGQVVGKIEGSKDGYTNYQNLSKGAKNIVNTYFTSQFNDQTSPYLKALKNKFLEGKLTEQEKATFYPAIEKFTNDFMEKGFKQNLVIRNLPSVKKANKVYTGFEEESVELNKFIEAGNLPKSTEMFNLQTGKFETIADIKVGNKKDDKMQINSEVGYTSPIFSMSGGESKWATPKRMVITRADGSTESYLLPEINKPKKQMDTDAAVAQNASANSYSFPVVAHNSDYKIKFVPLLPESAVDPDTRQKIVQSAQAQGLSIPGSYQIYDKQGKLIALETDGISSPEVATAFIEQDVRTKKAEEAKKASKK